MEFDDTVAGKNATSYISVDDADEILSGYDKWDDIDDDDQKEQKLIEATQQIETLRFHHEKYDSEQALAFPRDVHVKDGTPFMPLNVHYAVCAQIKANMDGTSAERAQAQADGVTGRRIGDISESYGESGGTSVSMGQIPLAQETRGYLSGFISRIGKIIV